MEKKERKFWAVSVMRRTSDRKIIAVAVVDDYIENNETADMFITSPSFIYEHMGTIHNIVPKANGEYVMVGCRSERLVDSARFKVKIPSLNAVIYTFNILLSNHMDACGRCELLMAELTDRMTVGMARVALGDVYIPISEMEVKKMVVNTTKYVMACSKYKSTDGTRICNLYNGVFVKDKIDSPMGLDTDPMKYSRIKFNPDKHFYRAAKMRGERLELLPLMGACGIVQADKVLSRLKEMLKDSRIRHENGRYIVDDLVLYEDTELPNGITEISGARLYDKCHYIAFPPSLRKLADGCFEDSEICCAEFREGIKELPERCFADSSLQSVKIPASVKLIHSSCFKGCSDLRGRLSLGAVKIWRNAFEDAGIDKIDLPNAKEIGPRAFRDCNRLASVRFDAVEEIYVEAFRDCKNLVLVSFGENVRVINDGAFYGCRSLCKGIGAILFPPTLRLIGKGAFTTKWLKRVYVPSSAVIQEGAFPKNVDILKYVSTEHMNVMLRANKDR